MQSPETYTLHVYDLPKLDDISTPLVSTISHIMGRLLGQAPIISRDPAK